MCSAVSLFIFFRLTKANFAESVLENVPILIFDVNFVDYILIAGGDGKMDEKTKNEE